ncbi:hypothetical protein A0J57_03955 [Sphingobium sp. 22B]|uniref:nuclear transport factor 2 family protein n=1 Tax=unclassified Sphingobium TaxID=2611147 RepID=UPI000784A8F7|nr:MULTISPECIES: nuclear transport factor 2 family protein [unclassified Sphingobium]KXU33803.1 hypothetical protein AXW74_00505 [Sphingobium sp. AM]KYC33748.1 hypothetical protein A0J57_03955 [Sphingobium sp. 22B]OAP33486.1 hypothetical protein A8O16_03175 [Sphingobium sp. 20006FA]
MSDDYERIRQLSYEYSYLLDAGDFAGLGELLRHGRMCVTWLGVQGPWFTGAKEVEQFYRREVSTYDAAGRLVLPEHRGDPLTRHVISNHSIHLDGNKGSGISYYTVYQRPPGQAYQIVLAGRYEDRFEKMDGVWHFMEKNIVAEYLNDVGYHARAQERAV